MTVLEGGPRPELEPDAFVGEETGQLVSDEEVAQVSITAFTSRRAANHVSAGLIVRRVKRSNPKTVPENQNEPGDPATGGRMNGRRPPPATGRRPP